MLNPCALASSRAHTKPKIMLYNLTPESEFSEFELCRLAAEVDNVILDVLIYYNDLNYSAHHDCSYASLVTYMFLMNADPHCTITKLQVEILPF